MENKESPMAQMPGDAERQAENLESRNEAEQPVEEPTPITVFEIDEQISAKERDIADTQGKITAIREELGLPPTDEIPPSIKRQQEDIEKLNQKKQTFDLGQEKITQVSEPNMEAGNDEQQENALREERTKEIQQELIEDWKLKHGPTHRELSQKEIAEKDFLAENLGGVIDENTTRLNEDYSNFYFGNNFAGNTNTSVPEKADQILNERFPEYEARSKGVTVEQVMEERKANALTEIKSAMDERERIRAYVKGAESLGGYEEEQLIDKYTKSGLLTKEDVEALYAPQAAGSEQPLAEEETVGEQQLEKSEVEPEHAVENVIKESDVAASQANPESQGNSAKIEIKKEFIDEIINAENMRYKSEEAMLRAQRIDTDFPPDSLEKMLNRYKSQEKNIDYIGHDPNIFIGDWLDEGAGGFYRQQPPFVSRKKDFIEVTNKAEPQQMTQILQHEYNHMVTQGHSNFSNKYKEYMRGIFLSDEELKQMSGQEEYKLLDHEPFPGAGSVRQYLTTPAEINAYLGTNLRHDLLRSGIIKNFYDPIDKDVLEKAMSVADSNCNREKTPIYKIYAMMAKDKDRLAQWLNTYAI